MDIEFELERETKNTYRFREVEAEEPPKVGTLYIKKWAFKKLGNPRKIKITIKPAKS